VIRRRARKRKPQRDIYGTAERRNLDGRHPDIVIWRDHGVKFTADRSHENRIRRKGPINSRSSCGRREKLGVFAAEPSAIASVRIESAQRNSRRRNSEPRLQPVACDASGFDDTRRGQILRYAVKRDVGRREHHPELVRCEHHRNARSGEGCKHFGVTGKIVAARMQRSLIDWSGHNSFDRSGLRHLHGPLDCQSAELARERRVRPGPPLPDGLGHTNASAVGTDDHNVTALADLWVGERFGDNLGTNSAGIAHGHGKANFHRYILSDT
jgi:hypothetical protein